MTQEKKYDFILLGATSFVGASIIRYITNHEINDSPFAWAVAARSESKMTSKLTHIPDDKKPDQLVVDTNYRASIDLLCNKTNVILSTVGPYALYGEKVVAACVDAGINYCDLSGESFWIAKMIEKYHDKAVETGAHIIPSSGFDSIPSDMGMKFLQEQSQAQHGELCTNVTMGVKAIKGSFSGGTFASMLNAVEEAIKNPELRKVAVNPYSHCPKDHSYKLRQPRISTPIQHKGFNSWLSSFVMASANTTIIHRTNYLLNNTYTDQLLYAEATITGKGMSGAIKAFIYSYALIIFFILTAIKPTRWILKSFILPKPGEGPSLKEQDNGFFILHFHGETPSSKVVQAKVKGLSDPGYGWTAKAITQTALALAFDIPKHKGGGFWTTAALFDKRFEERLRKYADLNIETLN